MCDDLHAGRIDTPEKMRRYYEVMGPLDSRTHDPKSGVGLGSTILEPEAQNRAIGPGGFMWTLNLRPELGRIRAPTLILAGRHDFRCAPEFSEEMHQLIRGSDLRIFEQSGHTIGTDEPQNMLDAIAGFVVYKARRHSE